MNALWYGIIAAVLIVIITVTSINYATSVRYEKKVKKWLRYFDCPLYDFNRVMDGRDSDETPKETAQAIVLKWSMEK